MMKRLTAAAVAATIVFFSSTAPAQAAEPYWQCVTFARMFSGIQIFGDAWTWWESATGKYAKGSTPETGAVLVFRPNGKMTRGHVAVISQVLMPKKDGKGRIAAFEVMLMTPAVANLIRKAETNKIPSTIQTSRRMGMITLDDSLLELCKRGAITREVALENSQDPRDLETRL